MITEEDLTAIKIARGWLKDLSLIKSLSASRRSGCLANVDRLSVVEEKLKEEIEKQKGGK